MFFKGERMEETKRERFVKAWETVFDVAEVKDDDNFFEVGGDSMKGVQLVSALAGYGLKLDMLKLYTQPTVEELVEAAEEMEPVDIPADVISGNLSGEEIEKYLADPMVQKAMTEFGIRVEDVRGKIGMSEKKSNEEEKKAAGRIPPSPGVQPGAAPLQAGYFIPVPMMYYFVPVSGSDKMCVPPQEAFTFAEAAPTPDAASFPGVASLPGLPGTVPFVWAAPVPLMAYPVYPVWPNETGNPSKNADSDKKEE